MAIAYVGNRGSGTPTISTSTTQFSPTSTIAAGDLVVLIYICAPTAARTLNSVTDSGSNTWTVDKQIQNGTSTVCVIASSVLTTQLTISSTITATWSATMVGQVPRYNCEEFSGVASSTWTDVTASATGSGTALTAGTTAAAAAGDLGIGGWGITGSSTFTADGSHTKFTDFSTGPSIGGEYNVSVSGTQSATMTASATGTWAGVQATYKAAAASTQHLLATMGVGK